MSFDRLFFIFIFVFCLFHPLPYLTICHRPYDIIHIFLFNFYDIYILQIFF